jgi:hypothetical protein
MKYFRFPFAEGGDKETVPDETAGTLVSYETGYTPDYELPKDNPSRRNIDRQPYNGVLNDVTGNLKQLQDYGYPEFVPDDGTGSPLSYQIGRVVWYVDTYYRALVLTNTAPPSAQWAVVTDLRAAASTSYNNATSGLTAVNSQAAIDEIKLAITNQSVAGSATFSNTTNNIALTGIGSIGLEIGDVVQVTGTASNNKLFTVEVITDNGNVIVNQAHAGGTTSKSLVDETVSANVTLVAKWFCAPLGLGQGWVSMVSSRDISVNYTNSTGRTISFSTLIGAIIGSDVLHRVDGVTSAAATDDSTDNPSLTSIVPHGSVYTVLAPGGAGAIGLWGELR